MNPRASARANDTIAAIGSPPGAAARGVIRVSGPRARELVLGTWSGDALDLSARTIARGRFEDGRGSLPLLLVWMKGPRSFTREDVAEFHLPGHPALLDAALAHLVRLGARLAEPGEFTRRAFHAGRIDLTRAEGVLALVFATNEAEARSARSLLYGGLEERVSAARAALLDVRTLVEAALDFDENDTGHVPALEIEALADRAAAALELALCFEVQRAPTGGLPRVALCGAPNAGKSALFNALTGAEALVSRHAGTTRDVLESEWILPRARALLLDTAGMEPCPSGTGAVAQVAAHHARSDADVLLWVVDGSQACRARIEAERQNLPTAPTILVWHKSDIAGNAPAWTDELGVAATVSASSTDGTGLEALREALSVEVERGKSGRGREIAARHRRAIEEARRELARARGVLVGAGPLELAAEHLRQATHALDDVSGGTTPEDVLDRIFAAFCLGK